jgi:hypothetical protein
MIPIQLDRRGLITRIGAAAPAFPQSPSSQPIYGLATLEFSCGCKIGLEQFDLQVSNLNHRALGPRSTTPT